MVKGERIFLYLSACIEIEKTTVVDNFPIMDTIL